MVKSVTNSSLNGMKFGKDGDGNYGYYGADGSLIPFKSGDPLVFDGQITIRSDNRGSILKSNEFYLWSSGNYGAFSVNVKDYSKAHVIVNARASLLNTNILGTDSREATSGTILASIPASVSNNRYKDLILDVSEYDWLCIYCPYYTSGSDSSQSVIIDKIELL